MNSTNLASPPEINALNQAAEWFAVLQDTTATKSDYEQWEVWLNSHPHHQSAWVEVQAIFPPFEHVANIADKQATKATLMQPTVAGRRHALKLLGLGTTALITGLLVKDYSPWRDWVTTFAGRTESLRVAVGETGMTRLAEGSKLWLNTGSQAKVEYSFALRRITLLTGELFIESAKDSTTPTRPLVVDTRHGRLTALGTRFTVKLTSTNTLLAVYQGAVSISPSDGSHVQVVKAGQQIVFNANEIMGITPADKARETWTRGMLLADNIRLDDFIAELATYRQDKLSVAPGVAHLSLMGAFPLRDTNLVLQAITEVLPVRIHRVNANNIELVARN